MKSILGFMICSMLLCTSWAFIPGYEYGLLNRLSRLETSFNDNNKLGTPYSTNNSIEMNDPPCCFPPVWQGTMYRYISSGYIEYLVTFYENSQKNQLAVDIVITTGESKNSTKHSQIIVTDDSAKTAYIYQFNKETKTCQRTKFANITYAQITGRCVPERAFFFGSVNMGIPKGGSSFNVRSWMWKPLPTMLPHLHLERIVSKDCAPVLEIVRGTMPGAGWKGSEERPVLQSDYYFNIETSIKDPSVFDLPSYCKKPGVRTHIVPGHKTKKYMARKLIKQNAEFSRLLHVF